MGDYLFLLFLICICYLICRAFNAAIFSWQFSGSHNANEFWYWWIKKFTGEIK